LATQQVVTYVATFIYYALLLRVLNLSQIGEVSLLALVMSIFTTLTQVALPSAATRFIASNIAKGDARKAEASARTITGLLLGIATPSLILAIFLSPWVGKLLLGGPSGIQLIIATFVTGFIIDITTLLGSFFLGLGMYSQSVYQNVLYVPLSRGLGLTLAYSGFGVSGIVLGWVCGGLATLALSTYLLRGRLALKGSYPIMPLMTFSLPVFSSTVITLLQNWGDIAILQALIGQLQTTGAYYLVVSRAGFLSILWTPLTGAAYPAFSVTHSTNGAKGVSSQLIPVFRLINVIVLPICVGLAAVAPSAIEVVYGPALVGQSIPFVMLVLATIFSAQGAILVMVLQATGNTRPLLKIFPIATVLDLATVFFGAEAFSTLAGAAGRVVLAVATFTLAWQSLRLTVRPPVLQDLDRGLILAFTIGILLFATNQLLTYTVVVRPLIRLPVIVTVFCVSFMLLCKKLKALREEDFDAIETATPKFLHGFINEMRRRFELS